MYDMTMHVGPWGDAVGEVSFTLLLGVAGELQLALELAVGSGGAALVLQLLQDDRGLLE